MMCECQRQQEEERMEEMGNTFGQVAQLGAGCTNRTDVSLISS